MAKPQVRVGLGTIIWGGPLVLLHKRRGGHQPGVWCSPGGHLEYGESWEDCALREIREECGPDLRVSGLRYWHTVDTPYPEEGRHYVTIFFRADHVGGLPVVAESDKCECWEWFPWTALPRPLMLGNQRMLEAFPRGESA